MNTFERAFCTLLAIMLILPLFCLESLAQAKIPYLRKQGTATQLVVDGKPYLVLGGELHNSTSSSLAYMEPIMKRFSADHLNTALASVCWDLIEPVEGK